ncbi:hypothetical protein CBS470a_005964 [Colletotrichum nupharicola]|nr:hypothetical protein CBS470a_005964 [Colletotrichum nupharicola]
MLGDMKAIKMLGLPEVLSGVILQLRRVELSRSEKFRKLLLWQVLGIACFTRIEAFCLKASRAPQKGSSGLSEDGRNYLLVV